MDLPKVYPMNTYFFTRLCQGNLIIHFGFGISYLFIAFLYSFMHRRLMRHFFSAVVSAFFDWSKTWWTLFQKCINHLFLSGVFFLFFWQLEAGTGPVTAFFARKRLLLKKPILCLLLCRCEYWVLFLELFSNEWWITQVDLRLWKIGPRNAPPL